MTKENIALVYEEKDLFQEKFLHPRHLKPGTDAVASERCHHPDDGKFETTTPPGSHHGNGLISSHGKKRKSGEDHRDPDGGGNSKEKEGEEWDK